MCPESLLSYGLFFYIQESEDQRSLSSREGFVCREGCVFSLSPRPGVSVGKHGGIE